ncbi:S24 family peptidase [Actinopolymorpha singaporensis]|uniref:Peptidase S24-like n=1 Tax=Actinopolymorpha singaporensis TaxID=117157 RepID=A0A1H1YMD2_9ACTN|nr:Peptidase S24-like [Actinopolymorpha singaporensis]
MPRFGIAVVRGRSMQPTLRDGDRLVVRYNTSGTAGETDVPVRPGSLVLVRLPHRPLSVKRLVRREPEGWWVERDNPYEGVDSWQVGAVPPQDLVAVVISRLRLVNAVARRVRARHTGRQD